MKKLKPDYISFHMGEKPNLEGFVNVNDFNMGAIDGNFKETENQAYYYNDKLKVLLYNSKDPEPLSTIIGGPIPKPKDFKIDKFTVSGKPKSVLKYLKANHPKAHLRLYNYLKYGIDTEFVKKAFQNSQAHIEAYENLTGVKLKPKEE